MTAITPGRDGSRDFDFLFGSWRVRHRKLVSRLAGDDRWSVFDGTMVARAILGGGGNFDENLIEDPAGAYRACTIRKYDPASMQWSIHWIDGRSMRPDPPITGLFTDGVGLFLGRDEHDGRPVGVRFVWSGIGDGAARWEQAFSAEAGASWEVNWIMDFERQS